MNARERLAELLHDRADLGAARGEGDFLVSAEHLVVDLADRGNDRRGAAQAALAELARANLFPGNRTLLDRHAEVFRHLDERTARDGREDGIGMGLRNDKRAILLHEQHVRATRFLDVGAGLRVEVKVVAVAVAMSFHDRLQGHSVVQAGLDVAGAVRSSAVVLGHTQLDGLKAALEVGADRRYENAELVLIGGSNADDVAGREHERTHVQRRARAERRNPCSVRLDDLLHRFDEAILGERRHFKTLRRVVHARGVHVGAEAHDVPVLGGIRLQAFEDLLAIVKDACALGDIQRMVGGQLAFAPLAVLVVAHIAVIRLAIAEIEATPIQILLLDCHCLLLHANVDSRGHHDTTNFSRAKQNLPIGHTTEFKVARWSSIISCSAASQAHPCGNRKRKRSFHNASHALMI